MKVHESDSVLQLHFHVLPAPATWKLFEKFSEIRSTTQNFSVIALKCRYQQHENQLSAKFWLTFRRTKKGSIYRIHNYIHNIINGTSSVYDPCTADGSLLVCGDQNTKFLLHSTCINYSKARVWVNEFVTFIHLTFIYTTTLSISREFSNQTFRDVLSTGDIFFSSDPSADENQIDSTAKFQLFFHRRVKTSFFHNKSLLCVVLCNFFYIFSVCQEKKRAHSKLCISLRCLPRALNNTTIESTRSRERKKEVLGIFYYYFSTPIFMLGILRFFPILETSLQEQKYFVRAQATQ